MIKKLIQRTISVILVIAMIFEVGTPLAYAAGLDGEEQAEQDYLEEYDGSDVVFDPDTAALLNSTNDKGATLKASDATVAGESVKRRDEHIKGYRLSDGSDAVFLYPFAVNEKDAEENWVEIDNRLIIEQDKDGKEIYTAESFFKDSVFYAEPSSGRVLELTTSNGSIGWGLMDIAPGVTATCRQPQIEEGYSVLQPKAVGSILTYKDVKPDMDLRLQLVGNNAEENVILNNPAAAQIAAAGLSYRLNLTGYTAELSEEGILLIPEGSEEAEYAITASYMEDVEGAWSKDIQVSLTEDAEGYIVTVIPSSEWLLSPERIYPIVIDPTIAQRTSTSILRATTVTSVSTYDPQYICGTQHVGKDGAYYGKMRVALQFDLPTAVTEADMVIDAGIIVKQRGYSGASGEAVTVNAHRMTTTATINWNFKWATLNGHYEDTVLDSQTMTSSTSGSWVTWDITKAVKDWYINGDNHGIALVSENEETAYKYIGFISPYDTGVSSSNYPIISITFLNQEGLESYLSYHSAGRSSMGTVYVSDFTGDLVYTFDDLSLSGEYLPLSIQHVYEHSQRTNADTVNSSMHFGTGFRLNVSQKINAITDTDLRANGYWYALTDADGTVHYFRLKSGTGGANGSTYEKEFETTTILTKTSSGFTLDYSSDLVYTFDTMGLLTKVQDSSNGKSMTFTYSSGRLTRVKDGAEREAALSYDTGGYLTKITDPAGRETAYTYSSGRLTRITSPDGKYVQFTYAPGGDGTQMMTAVTDIDGSKIQIEYYTNAPCRVKSLLEKGTSSGEGGKLTWTYGAGETVITDRKGNSETMMFDSAGHTVCVKDALGNAVYGKYNNTDDNKKHTLKLRSDLQGTVANYLADHDFEGTVPSPWTEFKSADADGSIASDTSQKVRGNRSLRITSTQTSGHCGISQTVFVPGCKGKEVTISAYIKITDLVQADGEETAGLLMRAWYRDASGTWVAADPVRQTSNTGWKDLAVTFTVPQDATSEMLFVRAYFYHASGNAYLDCMQLETGAVRNRYNLLENGHFKDASGTNMAEGWSGTNLIPGTDRVSEGHDLQGFRITGEADKAKYIYQTVNVSGNAGDSYVFGVWGKAEAIRTTNDSPHLISSQSRPFGVILQFYRQDGTHQDVSAVFEAKSSGWQYLCGTAAAPCDYTRIAFFLIYSRQKNAAIFDDAQLYREGFGSLYTYDSCGRTATETDPMGRTTTYTYLADSRPEISSITYPDGSQSTYTYDSATHNLLSVTDANGKTAEYSYDPNWNDTKVSMTCGGITLGSGTKTFGAAGYLSSSADSLGNTTGFSYNVNKGLLTGTTEANGSVTNYTYDADNDLLTKVQKWTPYVEYTYSNRNLTKLAHTAGISDDLVEYTFAYDQFGAGTAVRVGTQDLASYTYESNNGDLIRTTYGNGQYTEPVYDSYDRQTGLKVNGTLRFRWHYGADGRIGYEEDLVNNVDWRYAYNRNGEITSVRGSNGESISNAYDSLGKVTSRSVTSGGVTGSSQYSYDAANGFLAGITYKAGIAQAGRLDINRDGFERVSRTLYTSSDVSLPTTYTYMPGTGNDTTTLIPRTIRTAGSGWDDQYFYTYDSMGNISTVVYDSAPTDPNNALTSVKYTYDSFNKLVREDNQAAGKSWVYSYELGGNITSVKEYAYTTGTLGPVLSTKSYSYGDPNWKDKLTSYAGSSITYDAIGNPLSYRGMTFTWDAGRQLASATSGGTTTTYKYNSSGIRTSKTSGSTTTNYILSGTQVIKATTGSNYVLYYYDESGSPVMFRTKTGSSYANYYYVKDLQGDIVAITNASGAKVVEYTYDAWGKVLTTTGSLASTIGASNPYRYRGYWYDTETGLYYLQSRYYDPATGRFINADILVSTGQGVFSCNMFAYCENNPVSRIDTEGGFWETVLAVVLTVAAVVATVVTVGAAASAAACSLTLLGTSLGMSVAAAETVATVATVVTTGVAAMYAGDMAYMSVTGESALLDGVFGGNTVAYDTGLLITSIATAGMMQLAANSPGVCFIAGTLVLAEDGKTPIEEIEIGDYVFASDPETGEEGLGKVVNTYVNETDELIHLTVSGEKIVCTPSHPFYAAKKGWISAAELRAGDILVTVNGEYVVLEQIEHELLESPVLVYNLEVERYHTYYVSDAGVLVHNSCNHNSKWNSERKRFWKAQSQLDNKGEDYGAYIATSKNLERMSIGLAPIGWDGKSVQLHHWQGIKNNMYDYSPLSYTVHQRIIHSNRWLRW